MPKIKWLKEDTVIARDLGEKKEKVKKNGVIEITDNMLKALSHYKGYFEVMDESKKSDTPRITNEVKKISKS
jgi:hypothetical protein